MKTIQQNLESSNLTLNEAIDMAPNYPLWRLISTFDNAHSWWCMAEKNEQTSAYDVVKETDC